MNHQLNIWGPTKYSGIFVDCVSGYYFLTETGNGADLLIGVEPPTDQQIEDFKNDCITH